MIPVISLILIAIPNPITQALGIGILGIVVAKSFAN